MGVSAIHEQREIILATIRSITRGNWKVLIIDETTKTILDNVVKEDEILNENVTNIETIESRRDMQTDTDAIYLLSPQAHIVDCLLADLERHRYQSSHLVWIALLDPQLRRRIDSSANAKNQLVGFETLSIDFFPKESHLITFRDPWSFPILYNESCNDLVAAHLQGLAQKITGVCVSLGELPKVRYYRPRNPTHAAAVLCSHLARFVSEELDAYARWNTNFPPPSTRPQGVLLITDRSMDLNAPLLHEFTYQAMAHDLLPINHGEKTSYRTVVNQGQPDEEEKDMEIVEKDKIWTDYRHKHMMSTLNSIPMDFNNFKADNPHFFADQNSAANISAIKSMVVGLSQFQEQKEAYSLHLNMVAELMQIFEDQKLMDLVLLELKLATGLDEELRKAKGLAQEVVRQLDNEFTTPADRLRLIMLYLVYRGEGVIDEDIQRLLAHSNLPTQQTEPILNQALLGARILKQSVKESRPTSQPPLHPFSQKTMPPREEDSIEWASSRYEPQVKLMLEELAKGTLDTSIFPYHKPQADDLEPGHNLQTQASSLRSAKPTWARNRMSTIESRQRVIVFVAGGATFSESRSCHEISKTSGKDIFLATSHMLHPGLYVRQVADLARPRKQLDLPVDRPKKRAPDYLFVRNDPPPQPKPQPVATPPSRQPAPPVAQMAAVNLGGGSNKPLPVNGSSNGDVGRTGSGKLEKERPEKEKKKRNMFGMKR